MNLIAAKLAPLALAVLALTACDTKPKTPPADTRTRVLVSNPPTAWLVKQIAGDKVIVQTLAGGGGCGHGFQPTDAELAQAGKAQVWFTVGMEFESAAWTKSIRAPRASLGPTGHGWMSLKKLADMAQQVQDELNITSPAATLSTRPSAVALDIKKSHAKLQTTLALLKGVTFLADHTAYDHFASDYDLKQLAIEEEGHETSDAHLTDLITQAKQAQVKVLFLAEECNRSMAETLAKAVGAKIVVADPNEENTPALLERMARELVKAHEHAAP